MRENVDKLENFVNSFKQLINNKMYFFKLNMSICNVWKFFFILVFNLIVLFGECQKDINIKVKLIFIIKCNFL